MKPEHLKVLEPAARIYCRAIGVNPDKTTPEQHPLIQGVIRERPEWEIPSACGICS